MNVAPGDCRRPTTVAPQGWATIGFGAVGFAPLLAHRAMAVQVARSLSVSAYNCHIRSRSEVSQTKADFVVSARTRSDRERMLPLERPRLGLQAQKRTRTGRRPSSRDNQPFPLPRKAASGSRGGPRKPIENRTTDHTRDGGRRDRCAS